MVNPEPRRRSAVVTTPACYDAPARWPLVRNDEHRAGWTQKETMSEPRPRAVVVVDDALLLREVYAGFLEEHGFTVAMADGVEALFQVKRLRPIGVVLDVCMPRVDGLEILAEIKAVDPSIRIVVVTGLKERGLRERALALGASVFLEKPIDRIRLVAALTDSAS